MPRRRRGCKTSRAASRHRDLAADPRKVFLPLCGGELAHVAVGDPRRALLERRVNEPLVLVIPARGEPISDQMMNGPLDREHVHPAGEPEVRVEQIAVPILFGSPSPQPSRHGVAVPVPVGSWAMCSSETA